MPIQVECACGASFRVKDEMAGRRGKCPKCGGAIAVPAPEPTRSCPGCRMVYPAGVVVCTRCGIELATGRALTAAPEAGPRPRGSRAQPLRSRGIDAPESKSFFRILGQAFYAPTEAFESLGHYVLASPASIGLLIGLFFLGVLCSGFWQARNRRHQEEALERQEREYEEKTGIDPDVLRAKKQKVHERFAGDGYVAQFGGEGNTLGEFSFDLNFSPADFAAVDEGREDWLVESRVASADGPWRRAGYGDPLGPGMLAFTGWHEDVRPLVEKEGEAVFEVRISRYRLAPEAPPALVSEEIHAVSLGFEKSRREAYEATTASMGFAALLAIQVGVLLGAIALKAVILDVLALLFAGASRLLSIGIALFLLEGVLGLARAAVLLASLAGLPWRVVPAITVVLWLWGTLLYIVAIARTYDIPAIFAVAIAIGLQLLEVFVVLGVVVGYFAAGA